MKILIVGRGAREHALAWKLSQSARVEGIWVAPGNGGTQTTLHGTPIRNAAIDETDFAGLIALAQAEKIDLTIVGPEVPLAAGIVDAFQQADLRCFGPTQAAAQLEASKAFAKAFMQRHHIPTARYATFTDYAAAQQHLAQVDYPVVIKASGLAAGKGVIVPDSPQEAVAALHQMMTEHSFGAAGDEVVIEERLYGQEVSILAFSDGQTVVAMPPAQDHKPVFEGDRGPNTGGMGAYAPAPIVTAALQAEIEQTVLQPAIAGLAAEGIPFVGILFAGLMLTENGLRVLEYNCRFGDPETEVVLPLLKTDLLEIIEATLTGRLAEISPEWHPGAAATVVAASEGYPGAYPKDRLITGLDAASEPSAVMVFHAGTRQTADGQCLTAGGRVLTVTGTGHHLQQALDNAYAGLAQIQFAGMHYRRDIGAKALKPN